MLISNIGYYIPAEYTPECDRLCELKNCEFIHLPEEEYEE